MNIFYHLFISCAAAPCRLSRPEMKYQAAVSFRRLEASAGSALGFPAVRTPERHLSPSLCLPRSLPLSLSPRTNLLLVIPRV